MPSRIGPVGSPRPVEAQGGAEFPAWLDQANDAIHLLQQAVAAAPEDAVAYLRPERGYIEYLEGKLWAVGRELGVLP